MKKVLEEEIYLPEDIINPLEYLNYVKVSHEHIMQYLLMHNSEYEFNKDSYDYFMKEYNDAIIQFNIATNDILQDLNPAYLTDEYRYEYNFIDNKMSIYRFVEGE